jgi:HlyD family secretion protein
LALKLLRNGMDTHTKNEIPAFRDTAAQDQARQLSPLQRGKPWLWLALAATVIALLLWQLAPWLRAGASTKANGLRFASASKGEFVADASGYANVVAARAPNLFAAAEGSVHFQVEAGQSVAANEVLAIIDSPSLQATLVQEQSAMEAAIAEASRQRVANQRALLEKERARDQAVVSRTAALREQARAERAFALKAMSEVDYLRAKDAFNAAEINVRHASRDFALEREALALELQNRQSMVKRQRSVVDALQAQANGLTLRAPFAGVVGTRVVAERAQVAKDAPVIGIVDLREFELDLALSEIYSPLLRADLIANIERDGQSIPGKVRSVSPEISGGQVRLRIRFEGTTPQGLKQNQRLLTRIEFERRRDTITIPRGAYLDELNGKAIWLKQGQLIKRVPIDIGAIGADRVEVLRGLAAGDEVVTSTINAKPEQTEIYLQ